MHPSNIAPPCTGGGVLISLKHVLAICKLDHFSADRYCRCWKNRFVDPNANSGRDPSDGFRHAANVGRPAECRPPPGSASRNVPDQRSPTAGPAHDNKSPNLARFATASAKTIQQQRRAPNPRGGGVRSPCAKPTGPRSPVSAAPRVRIRAGRYKLVVGPPKRVYRWQGMPMARSRGGARKRRPSRSCRRSRGL
jgi:hypothetical protein